MDYLAGNVQLVIAIFDTLMFLYFIVMLSHTYTLILLYKNLAYNIIVC